MSLFKRPKKPIQQRRVFSAANISDDDENENFNKSTTNNDSNRFNSNIGNDSNQINKKVKKNRIEGKSSGSNKKSSLLSFGDEDDDCDGEIFQVKKSSHSKKVMKMMDKERRKKKTKDSTYDDQYHNSGDVGNDGGGGGYSGNKDDFVTGGCATNNSSNYSKSHTTTSDDYYKKYYDKIDDSCSSTAPKYTSSNSNNKFNKKRINPDNSNTIQTEIRTDDFVLVVKKTEPTNSNNNNPILNGRAALCAGKDDMSSDEDESTSYSRDSIKHRFSKPDNVKAILESGAIPDAAMIHAARKRREKARELGDFIAIEEKKPFDNKKGRLIRDDADDDISDDEERVDMSAITGAKEREERREKFYSVQQEYDSDNEMTDWENQQIRKGVTGAQLVTAQQESAIYSQYMIKPTEPEIPSTANLLEQAYARNSLEKPRQILLSTQKQDGKPSGPQTPAEIIKKLRDRVIQLKEIHRKHIDDVEQMSNDLDQFKITQVECTEHAPNAASKFRFYQDLRGYVTDLVECLDEKVPQIVDLERKCMNIMSKQANQLMERRRQDIRDQAKEITELGKSGSSRKKLDDEERIRRAAEREGRRTRRRRDRERLDFNNTHLDGMSSDDEIPDHESSLFNLQLEQITSESKIIFDDTTDDFNHISAILGKFETWKRYDIDTYNETYFSLSLPKILFPMIRLNLVTWNPLFENSIDYERMEWYNLVRRYGWNSTETDDTSMNDPDIKLIPILIEKIILPKLTEIIETCWDPLSTSQTLRLVGLIGRIVRDNPVLKTSSKYLTTLYTAVLDKMKSALDNDVFIPIFPKQSQDAKSSFFQRQFCSGLKLFRNLLSWQNILDDNELKNFAILSLLNRYLLSAIKVCTPMDSISKSQIIVNTLPRVWLQSDSEILESLQLFINFVKQIAQQLDKKNSKQMEKLQQVLNSLHTTM